jgi:hypothetical protein
MIGQHNLVYNAHFNNNSTPTGYNQAAHHFAPVYHNPQPYQHGMYQVGHGLQFQGQFGFNTQLH